MDRHVEAFLEMLAAERGAARSDELCPVVECKSVACSPSCNPPADATALFEDRHIDACEREAGGCGQSGRSGTDHDGAA